jgi:tRNA(Arg) A34 adenosine deaminase TadA
MDKQKLGTENEYMREACDLAIHSVKIGGGPFGCVIAGPDGNVIGKGHNMVTINNDPTQHAEIVAIRAACQEIGDYSLKDCTLYTSCEPCPMCLSAIYWARIPHVYYANDRNDAKEIGFDDEFIYEEIKKDIQDRSVKLKRVESDKALEGFGMWRDKMDKLHY